MRRVLIVALFLASSIGFGVLPASSDTGVNLIVVSFDFSDNSLPAAVSNGPFNVIADVFPAHTGGVVRMVAIAPDNSGASTLVCPFQAVDQSQVECAFNFTVNGVWTLKAQYSTDPHVDVSSVSITRLRVSN